MSARDAQVWKSSTFTIERRQEGDSLVFRFSGPFTARDMYGTLTPAAMKGIFEADPVDHQPPARLNIFDLTEVPYMDSCGLGLLVFHLVRCQNKGVRLVAAGVTPRVRDLLRMTKIDRLFPMTATVEEAGKLSPPELRPPPHNRD